MAYRPAVFTIHPGAPFLPTLAEALLSGRLSGGRCYRDDPLALADATVFLPTRRAASAFAGALNAAFAGGGAILPKIRAISDAAETVGADADPILDPQALALAPVIAQADRQLILARLVGSWRAHVATDRHLSPSGAPILVPNSTADAIRLAADLLGLIDQASVEGVDWSRLAKLVPDDYAAWWQMSLTFLGIAAEALPAAIAERDFIDARSFERRMIEAVAGRWQTRPPKGPVVLAGSTASMALTGEFAAAIARLPGGAIVLPGLELDASAEAATAALAEPSHPQHTMSRLINRLGVDRREVIALGAPAAPARDRARLVAAALLPATLTDRWPELAAEADRQGAATDAALEGLALVVAANEAEEALAAAVALREALERPGARAMLVTPDRTAARRVAAELARFGVEVEDSAGLPLPQTPYGSLALLVGEIVAEGWPAAKIASLLTRPLAAFGFDPARARAAGRVLETRVLRGPRLAGTARALVDAARKAVEAGAPADCLEIAERLAAAFAPLEAVFGRSEASLAAFIAAEEATLAAITATPAGAERAASRAQTMFAGLMAAFGAAPDSDIALTGADWPATLKAIIGNVLVRMPSRGAAVIVTGPLDARLIDVDRLVLAGLNEANWPQAVDIGPWLSRPMRQGLGLPPPELRIGLSAHDFAQALGRRDVVMIRAARAGGAPTVPSRFLQRLEGFIGEARTARLADAGRRYLTWARQLDDGPTLPRAPRPNPAPPLAARPRRLTVTEIETLIRDPYAIYARRVLGLEPLDELGELPDFGTRGTLVHAILSEFAKDWTGPFDDSAVAALRALGEMRLGQALADHPQMLALWRPRLLALAAYVIGHFEANRQPVARHAEIAGNWVVEPGESGFTLSGRADRIDVLADGRLSIVDFKTGTAPTDAQIAAGLAPQLPLEAAIAGHGGFAALGKRKTAELVHVVLRGLAGRDDVRPYTGYKLVSLEQTIAEAEKRLRALVAAYGEPKRGYLSRARPFKRTIAGTYDHLARVGEWSLGEGDGGEGEG